MQQLSPIARRTGGIVMARKRDQPNNENARPFSESLRSYVHKRINRPAFSTGKAPVRQNQHMKSQSRGANPMSSLSHGKSIGGVSPSSSQRSPFRQSTHQASVTSSSPMPSPMRVGFESISSYLSSTLDESQSDIIEIIEDKIEDLYYDFVESKIQDRQTIRQEIMNILTLCEIKIVKGLMEGGLKEIKQNQQLWYVFLLNFDFKAQWKTNALNFLKENNIMNQEHYNFLSDHIEVIPEESSRSSSKIPPSSQESLSQVYLNTTNTSILTDTQSSIVTESISTNSNLRSDVTIQMVYDQQNISECRTECDADTHLLDSRLQTKEVQDYQISAFDRNNQHQNPLNQLNQSHPKSAPRESLDKEDREYLQNNSIIDLQQDEQQPKIGDEKQSVECSAIDTIEPELQSVTRRLNYEYDDERFDEKIKKSVISSYNNSECEELILERNANTVEQSIVEEIEMEQGVIPTDSLQQPDQKMCSEEIKATTMSSERLAQQEDENANQVSIEIEECQKQQKEQSSDSILNISEETIEQLIHSIADLQQSDEPIFETVIIDRASDLEEKQVKEITNAQDMELEEPINQSNTKEIVTSNTIFPIQEERIVVEKYEVCPKNCENAAVDSNVEQLTQASKSVDEMQQVQQNCKILLESNDLNFVKEGKVEFKQEFSEVVRAVQVQFQDDRSHINLASTTIPTYVQPTLKQEMFESDTLQHGLHESKQEGQSNQKNHSLESEETQDITEKKKRQKPKYNLSFLRRSLRIKKPSRQYFEPEQFKANKTAITVSRKNLILRRIRKKIVLGLDLTNVKTDDLYFQGSSYAITEGIKTRKNQSNTLLNTPTVLWARRSVRICMNYSSQLNKKQSKYQKK